MTTLPALRLSLSVAAGISLAPLLPAQGPLMPPGAPSPTMKSLSDIDAHIGTAGERIPVNATTCPGDNGNLYIINASGSYFLTGNLVGQNGKHGIVINADGVTLDLNGYEVNGAAAGNQNGIIINGARVTVRNGRVASWGHDGLQAFGAGGTTFERVISSNNSASAFFIFGSTRYDSCSAINCGTGFFGDISNQYLDCQSENTAGTGFVLYSGNTAIGCVSLGDGSGYDLNACGIALTNCAATEFNSTGFHAYASGASLNNCVAATSSGAAVRAFVIDQGAASLTNCVAIYSGGGSEALLYGFDGGAASGVTYTHCSSSGWTGAGYSLGTGSTVANCSATANPGDGIVFTTGCTVTGSTARQNGGEGFSATGTDNRVDGNTSTGNGVSGFRSYDVSNVIVRNVARGNSPGLDYNPSVGANIGPVGQPAFATSPWANF